MPTTSVLISGVGGQGVVLVSELLALAALAAGKDVKQGEFHGVEPSGRLIHFKGIEIIRVRDGLITERWGEWDGMDLLEQLAHPIEVH